MFMKIKNQLQERERRESYAKTAKNTKNSL
jgi:hypothetical protein